MHINPREMKDTSAAVDITEFDILVRIPIGEDI
jgi:hypothetical protein